MSIVPKTKVEASNSCNNWTCCFKRAKSPPPPEEKSPEGMIEATVSTMEKVTFVFKKTKPKDQKTKE